MFSVFEAPPSRSSTENVFSTLSEGKGARKSSERRVARITMEACTANLSTFRPTFDKFPKVF